MLKLSTALQFLLRPLSFVYACLMMLRRRLYHRGIIKSYQLPGTTISVGNLELGGTGKSPVSIAICQQLLKHGYQPAIVTRGYKSGLKDHEWAAFLDQRVLVAPRNSRDFFGDEARMQSAALPQVPVIMGVNRWQACQEYLQQFPSPSHWVLDDGYQHLKIQRQLDILLMDAQKPLDNTWPIPSGRLREFPREALFADVVLLTRSTDNLVPSQLQFLSQKLHHSPFSSEPPSIKLGPQKGELLDKDSKVLLLSGVAKPEAILNSLQEMGYQVKAKLFVGDHEPFNEQEIRSLLRDCDAIVSTEKDYYRQEDLFTNIGAPVATIKLSADISSLGHLLEIPTKR